MRVAGTSLAVSFLLLAGPALAQGGGYYDSGGPHGWQPMNPDRFERYGYYPPPAQFWPDPMYYGPMRPARWYYDDWHQPGPHWRVQPVPPQQGMQGVYPPLQTAPSPASPVSATAQNQIKGSLESGGFRNVTVVPQSYLIRATAPDGSRIVMQVSSDTPHGAVANPAAPAVPGGTAGANDAASASGGAPAGGTGTTPGAAATGPATTGGASSGTDQTAKP
jgi:hypothetical protein